MMFALFLDTIVRLPTIGPLYTLDRNRGESVKVIKKTNLERGVIE